MQLSRFVLPAVLFVGSAVPFLAPTAAQATQPVRHEFRHEARYHHRHYRYEVFYRCGPRESWRCYGRFDGRAAAWHAADHLKDQGFVVRIDR